MSTYVWVHYSKESEGIDRGQFDSVHARNRARDRFRASLHDDIHSHVRQIFAIYRSAYRCDPSS